MVVTIVVLLILAGVSISLILDNNGIIQKSKDARKQYGEAQANEQADLEDVSSWIEKAASEFEIVEPENIDDWIYREEDDGTITIIRYKGPDTTVIVPNYINNKRVKKINAGIGTPSQDSLWSREICSNEILEYVPVQNTIKEVIISNGIESIDQAGWYGAFTNSKALEKVVIPDSVKYIGNHTFYNCTNLTNINIPNGVTNIELTTFGKCTSLTNIIIPNSVMNIGNFAFSNCTNLNNITIPNSVTTMGSAVFSAIPSITVNVPFKEGETPEGWATDWNGNNVTVNYLK